MPYFISHKSALEFWRSPQASEYLTSDRLRNRKLPTRAEELGSLPDISRWGLSEPLHVLVNDIGARPKSHMLYRHNCSVQLPKNSFIEVSPELLVSTPELCFVQMADEFDDIELIKLGIELCGTYRLYGEDMANQSFDSATPLTSVARLSSYVTRASGLKGRLRSEVAMRYIVDNSASPMETVMFVRFTLPYRLGGYSLPKPILNHPIYLPGRDMPLYRADQCWPEAKLIVEYNSKEYHAIEPEQIARDEIRRNALTALGYQVIIVTYDHLKSTVLLNKTVEEISKILGKRQQYPKGFAQRQAKLRRQLMPWL